MHSFNFGMIGGCMALQPLHGACICFAIAQQAFALPHMLKAPQAFELQHNFARIFFHRA